MRYYYTAFSASLLLAIAMPAVADPVTDWMEFAAAVEDAARTPDAPFDVTAYGGGTRTALAIFEAADAVDRKYRSWLNVPVAAAGASASAAVAAAAHDVLWTSYPSQRATIDERYALAIAGLAIGRSRDDGIAAGKLAAAAALQAGGLNPSAKLTPYWPSTAPGVWVATTPTVLDPHYAAMKPWFLTSAAQFRPGPPVALGSPLWLKDVDEVRRMGGKSSTERSTSDTILARFWAPYDTAPALHAVAAQPGRTLVQNARFYAAEAMVGDDISIALVEAKLHYGFWRPITAIRIGGGNPQIKPDPMWEPLLKTPMHPEYPCGHCVVAAATAAVIDAEGPVPAGGLPFSNSKMPGFVVTVPTTADYVRQVSFSRICAGVHYRSTAEVSEVMARKIAAYALARFAPPLN